MTRPRPSWHLGDAVGDELFQLAAHLVGRVHAWLVDEVVATPLCLTVALAPRQTVAVARLTACRRLALAAGLPSFLRFRLAGPQETTVDEHEAGQVTVIMPEFRRNLQGISSYKKHTFAFFGSKTVVITKHVQFVHSLYASKTDTTERVMDY